MIPKSFIDYYGDQTRWFLGTVVNIADDPLKLGRARVRIFGVYDEIEEEDLPWAQIVVPVTHTVHEGNGQTLGLLVGAQVFGIFLDGQNSQLPLIVGSIPKERDSQVKSNKNYPYNKVYKTESNHYKEYDDTPDKERIKEFHKSKTFWEITNDTFTINHFSGSSIIMDENGNVNITASGNGEVKINGKSVRLNS
jgi:hypothetical protein